MSSTGEINPTYIGKVVKFPSLSSIVPILLEGPKVFLYRPLSQHILKISSVEPVWIESRGKRLKDLLTEDQVYWQPETDLDYIVFQWIASIKQISSESDVLWVKSNDLFTEPQKTLNLVTEHFELPNVTDFSYCDIDVKNINIESKDISYDKIIADSIRDDKFELVPENYGIITETNPYVDSVINRIYDLGIDFNGVNRDLIL